MKKKSNKIPLAAGLTICFIFSGCGEQLKSYPVISINRSTAFSAEKTSNPLRLVVEIREDGVLSLNKIETGTISDLGILSEKIKAIFDDRANNKIIEREIFIERNGRIKNDDLNKLIEVLENLKASPVRVITEN